MNSLTQQTFEEQASFNSLPETCSTAATEHRPNWISVVPHLDPKYGGLSSAVPALSSAIVDEGKLGMTLAGFCRPNERFVPGMSRQVKLEHFALSPLSLLTSRSEKHRFRDLIRQAAGVHIHGLWQLSMSAAASIAKAEHKPLVISAHGMLENWALNNKKLKKAFYAALCERRNLRSAACLHALTEAEADDYRRFGLTSPVAIIPNGVSIPASVSSRSFLDEFPALRGKRLLLFLGRIHFKKGLDVLCEAWSRICRQWGDAQLVLAGPDFEDTRSGIEAQLAELKISERVTFTGMLSSNLKWSALQAAECFVLPSYSEGLSVSVLEAMGMRRPVVVTHACNLPEVASHACGWVIQPRVDELEATLQEVLCASEDERRRMGSRAHALATQRYSWPAIGKQMTALYEWLAGGKVPTNVDLREGRR